VAAWRAAQLARQAKREAAEAQQRAVDERRQARARELRPFAHVDADGRVLDAQGQSYRDFMETKGRHKDSRGRNDRSAAFALRVLNNGGRSAAGSYM
jgi:multidrug efflux pump subunit AcrA (membrane-fusion protein)